jgi:hypothetical protein
MIGCAELRTSSITCLRRFSNSPLTPAPAWRRPRSSVRSATFWSGSGTSPSEIRRAKPSTTAVLPTPASPVRIGLFWRRRVRMSMIWRISGSRPTTGSIFPVLASWVRSIVNWSSEGVREAPPAAAPAVETSLAAAAEIAVTSRSSWEPPRIAWKSFSKVSTLMLRIWSSASIRRRRRRASERAASSSAPERTLARP